MVRTPITANGVTYLMILSGWCIAAALLLPGWPGALLAVFFANLQMYVDCCDGEVARWRGTSSPAGVFLDKVGHYTTEGLVALALGLRAADLWAEGALASRETWQLAFCGALLAAGVLLNKAQNDMVHVSRAFAGMGRLPDTAEAKQLRRGGPVAAARRVARFLPFHRLFHSVELSLLALAAVLVSTVLGTPLLAERVLVVVLAAVIWLVNLGHFVAIMASARLRS
nr:CDP-alcohol phosphatidyltransferase family protein [Auraticoccus cholistanensis]